MKYLVYRNGLLYRTANIVTARRLKAELEAQGFTVAIAMRNPNLWGKV